jgi:signal transduction histidine kinase
LLIAPLVAHGHKIGLLVFGRTDRAYAPKELTFVEEIAHRAALALDNARLFREAKDAVRARDEFIGIASHELRTPLTPLRLTLDALLRAHGGDERLRPSTERAIRQVSRLSALIDQLLDVTRILEGRVSLDREEVDLAELFREVVARFQPTAERSGSTIEILISGPVLGWWDPLRIDQILTNLVSNAIKYGGSAPIQVSLDCGPERAVIRVRDRGIGISTEDQARIFQRFERAVSARNYGGFGLGLWIVKKLVEQMGGTIQVESELERGSTFIVDLPVVHAPDDQGTLPPRNE